MKLYLPTSADDTIPTLPSRWAAALNPFAGTDGNGTSYETGMLDNPDLPFYRLRSVPQDTRGTISNSASISFAAAGSPNLTYKQWFVAGAPFVTGGTCDASAVLHASWFAASGRRTSSWGGAFQGGNGVIVPYVYVYRPSTASVVGTLAWLNGGEAIRAASASSTLSIGPYAGGTSSNVYQWTEWIAGAVRSYYTQADVVVQAGDYLCYEAWLIGRSTTGYTDITYSIEFDCGMLGTALYDQAWGQTSSVARDKATFFYVDDLLATPLPIPTLDVGTAVPATALISVDPGSGPKISLTFDNPVSITGPTIGAASAGLGVTGATSISDTQIDLACAIRPDPPDGDATSATLVPPIGEADNLGPPVPTGVGATVT